MQRVTITLDNDLMAELDRYMVARQYANRSEAIRDLVRAGLGEAGEAENGARPCVAALVYVFDHERRDLAARLTHAHHDHHDLSLATTHVHLDNAQCLEVALLRGPVAEVRHFADHLMAERGVRHGRLVVVPSDTDEASH
ncbi:nickel-responsive transcriptional regulator NikR [Zavarzinia sp.]|uniref:nickel-responsive transcriptional regulator NikR n=1 Tax=Zavarzinia sp. TaxID=2027920 RepID=UPI0035644169